MTETPVRPESKRRPLRKPSHSPAAYEGARDGKHFHILPASSNLLGIALLIITGLRVANVSRHTFADEIAWVAAICFAAACILSYLAIRRRAYEFRFEHLADRVFLVGLITLFISVVVLALHETPL